MNERDDSQLDELLREHLTAELDGQLGRAAERFLREANGQAGAPCMRLVGGGGGDDDGAPARAALHQQPRRGWAVFAWSIGLAGGAVAAGMAVVMVLTPMLNAKRTIQGGNEVAITDPNPDIESPLPTLPGNNSNNTGQAPVRTVQDLEHALNWQTLDQGTVYLDGEVPLRSIVRRANETVRWYDPQHKAHVEMSVPRDQVMLVGYGSQ